LITEIQNNLYINVVKDGDKYKMGLTDNPSSPSCFEFVEWEGPIHQYPDLTPLKEKAYEISDYKKEKIDEIFINLQLNLDNLDPKFQEELMLQKTEHGLNEYDNLQAPLSHYIYTYFEYLFPGNGKKALLMWLNALSTARGNPAGVIIKGDPGEGKTKLMDMVFETIPNEYKIVMSNGTESALFGKGDILGVDYLDKKVVYLGDLGASGALEKTHDIRETLRRLMTDGYKNRTLRDPKDKKTVLDEELKGYPAMWYTTVREDAEDQELDRSIVLTPNLVYKSKVKYIMKMLKSKRKSKTGQFLFQLKEKWTPIFQSIFHYLAKLEIEPVIPFDLENGSDEYRFIDKIMDISINLSLIDNKWRYTENGATLVHERDVYFAMDIIGINSKKRGQLSELQGKRLKKLQETFGSNNFTGPDVKEMFPDAYKTPETARSQLLKPATTAKILLVDETSRPYKYTFIEDETPQSSIMHEKLKIDYNMLHYEFNMTYHDVDVKKMDFVHEIDKPVYMEDIIKPTKEHVQTNFAVKAK
jgi:hypothetical protein